jgi:hypothetical protein
MMRGITRAFNWQSLMPDIVDKSPFVGELNNTLFIASFLQMLFF